MLGAQAIGAQVRAVQVGVAARGPARVVCFEDEFTVRQSGREEEAEVQDSEDQGVEASRYYHPDQQLVGFEGREDRN